MYSRLDNFFAKFNSVHTYKKGEIIIRADDTPSGIFYLKKGFVRLYSISKDGQEITFNVFKVGSYFPMIWAIGNFPNTYFFEAMTNVKLVRASKEELIKFLKEDPENLWELTRRILVGLNGLLALAEYRLFGDAHTKVASIVLTAARRFGEKKNNGEIVINLPLTHRQIASLTGLTRETTSLAMKKLKDEGVITNRYHFLVVSNIKKLEKKLSLYTKEELSPATI